MSFCQICERPLPAALLSDDICGRCWCGHAANDLERPAAQAWALAHAEAARGPLLLTDGTQMGDS